jgi:hypothetical protein
MKSCQMVSPQPALALIPVVLARIASIADIVRKKAESAACASKSAEIDENAATGASRNCAMTDKTRFKFSFIAQAESWWRLACDATLHSVPFAVAANLAVVLLVSAALIEPALAQKKLTAVEAKEHVGETATICGTIVSAHFATSTKGRPTFLNVDKPYPNQIFTIVIWGSDRGKFGQPEVKYEHRRVCMTGAIKMY